MGTDTLKSDTLIHELNYEETQREADAFILGSSAAVVVNDATGKIIRVTREVEESLGYLQNELLGEQLEILIPEMLRSKHIEHRTSQSGVATTRQMAFGRTVTARMKNGKTRDVTISLKSKFIINKSTGEKDRWTRAQIIFSPEEK